MSTGPAPSWAPLVFGALSSVETFLIILRQSSLARPRWPPSAREFFATQCVFLRSHLRVNKDLFLYQWRNQRFHEGAVNDVPQNGSLLVSLRWVGLRCTLFPIPSDLTQSNSIPLALYSECIESQNKMDFRTSIVNWAGAVHTVSKWLDFQEFGQNFLSFRPFAAAQFCGESR